MEQGPLEYHGEPESSEEREEERGQEMATQSSCLFICYAELKSESSRRRTKKEMNQIRNRAAASPSCTHPSNSKRRIAAAIRDDLSEGSEPQIKAPCSSISVLSLIPVGQSFRHWMCLIALKKSVLKRFIITPWYKAKRTSRQHLMIKTSMRQSVSIDRYRSRSESTLSHGTLLHVS